MGLEARTRLSESQSIENRGGRSQWFTVNGVKVQGTWEKKVALKLCEMGITWIKLRTHRDIWKYEIDGQTRSYTPDFYLPLFDLYLEIKGYWWGNDKEKILLATRQNPNKRLFIVERSEYEKILDGELVWL